MGEQREPRERRNRLIIYAVLFLLVALGLLFPGLIKSAVAPEAVEVHSLVAQRGTGGRALVLYDGGGGESQRQLTALLRQLLRAGASVVAAASSEPAAIELDRVLRAEVAASRRTYGAAAVNLGFRAAGDVGVFFEAVARSFHSAAEGRDHSGADLDLLPLIHVFRQLDDASIWAAVASGGEFGATAAYSLSRQYSVPFVLAATGDESGLAVQLWQEGRVEAALPGGKATTDYESMVEGNGSAGRRMTALTLGTLFIMALIIWAYLSGFITRRRESDLLGGILT